MKVLIGIFLAFLINFTFTDDLFQDGKPFMRDKILRAQEHEYCYSVLSKCWGELRCAVKPEYDIINKKKGDDIIEKFYNEASSNLLVCRFPSSLKLRGEFCFGVKKWSGGVYSNCESNNCVNAFEDSSFDFMSERRYFGKCK
jgi:hypothetical protein